ncbi:hypothetical protein PUN28_009749 [Cardiocondyla obscurior]|uniref:Uncharacterized protein n=1 Tax=Cardiocondyla obscurior TaxID=286306 RepID=A0AAW2FR39_9HYME
MHLGLFGAFYFHQKPRYGQKTKKIFLKFYNVALCIWSYSESFIFIRSRDMAKKQKKIHCATFKIDAFGPIRSLLFSSEAEIWPKNEKKNFEILQRSILSIFTSSRDMAKKQKKIFLKFYNVALYQKPRYGQKTKENIFDNLATNLRAVTSANAHVTIFSVLFFPEAEILTKNEKKNFENLVTKKNIDKKRKKIF